MTTRYTRPAFSARPTYEASEQWRPVLGYEQRYEVSDFGRVRCVFRRGRARTPRVLRLTISTYGYHTVHLCDGSTCRTRLVHRLVIEAFTGERIPKGLEVNHIDADRINNHMSNLDVVTGLQNAQHKSALDRHIYGERNKQTTLKESDIRAIRAMRAEGQQYKEIAAIYGISPYSVYDIVQRRRWAHVA